MVDQYECDGTTKIKTWNSATTAAKSFGKPKQASHIISCSRGFSKTAFGFKWQYTPMPDLEDEIWLPCPYNPGYKVSTKNRVESKTGYRTKGSYNRSRGYVSVYVGVEEGRDAKHSSVKKDLHRLVAEAFLPKPIEEGLEVDHKDGNIRNNEPYNLEWVTPTENKRRHQERYKSRLRGYDRQLTLTYDQQTKATMATISKNRWENSEHSEVRKKTKERGSNEAGFSKVPRKSQRRSSRVQQKILRRAQRTTVRVSKGEEQNRRSSRVHARLQSEIPPRPESKGKEGAYRCPCGRTFSKSSLETLKI